MQLLTELNSEIDPTQSEYETPMRNNPACESRTSVYNEVEVGTAASRTLQPYALFDKSCKIYETISQQEPQYDVSNNDIITSGSGSGFRV